MVMGPSLNSPMNLVTANSTYAAISRELGRPLRYPASPHFSPYCFGDQSLAALTTLSSSIVSSVALTGEMPLFSPV
jgi:hypothetical protein